jgi:hypothetical protein
MAYLLLLVIVAVVAFIAGAMVQKKNPIF